ncbi:helix-turn-helix domain-containing protein [Nocardia vinacea]|uniref:Helix-turn-helix domain-containing protein n=1 Tax=Nocardia vinacea TaxID=96468 RepID=A0ABZ1YND5_9NOCA|nr:helix-turn-helix domain-containing protein [Nocardia vinacea]
MKVAVHVFDGISAFHLSVPLLVFGEVERQGVAQGWSTRLWSETGDGRLSTFEGVGLEGVAGVEVAAEADLVILPSWHGDLRPVGDHLAELIRQTHHRGARVAGLCLGAFPVVDSGLLDGRTAVTHWAAADALATRRATVSVQSDALYLDHGDVLTSAGTASAIDACLHLLRTELGASVASLIARHLVVAPHRDGGQAQYVDRLVPETYESDLLGTTIEWALNNLNLPLSIEQLARHAGMSRRNFTRRFVQATGVTPARWVLLQRLDQSRELLESTGWPIDRIARTCGFASAVTFRQNFVAAYGTTPSSYRQRFYRDTQGPRM